MVMLWWWKQIWFGHYTVCAFIKIIASASKGKFLVVYYNLNMKLSSQNTHDFPTGGSIER